MGGFLAMWRRLVASGNALADTLDEARVRFRALLALDEAREELPALPAPEPARKNGRARVTEGG
jgi:hypothetical protein